MKKDKYIFRVTVTCKFLFNGMIDYLMGCVMYAVDHLVNNAGITSLSILEEATDITNFRTIMVTALISFMWLIG